MRNECSIYIRKGYALYEFIIITVVRIAVADIRLDTCPVCICSIRKYFIGYTIWVKGES